jgi:FlaA1/EpsC-like NDP-sugar epimerase
MEHSNRRLDARITNPLLRRAMLAAWDVLCWMISLAVVIGTRYEFQLNSIHWTSVLRYGLLTVVLTVGLGYAFKLYRGLYRVGSFNEAMGLSLLMGAVGLLAGAISLTLDPRLPRSVPLLVPPVALLGAAFGRWLYRASRDHGYDGIADLNARPAVIYGAGDAGYQVLRLLLTDGERKYEPIGFIDDNPAKRNLRLMGVPVIGDGASLPRSALDAGAEVIILAITAASGEFLGRLQDLVQGSGMELVVVPRLSELIGGRVELHDIRKVEIGDILGRHQVSTDLGKIADYLAGKSVLITGAGGSIGSELARQVHRFGPKELILLDRDESALHSVQLSLYNRGLLDSDDTVLCDIRDLAAMRTVFENHRPQIVFHAAALKHLPLLERFPVEGWKTNVCGTLNVLTLAAEFEVDGFVNISTDKAADSSSVLGRTKRLAEQLTAWFALDTGRPYISVRFGNVLGSRGSMVHAFNAQIEKGGPVTVTHPDVERYFMTIPEACELVIQAGAIGGAGQVLVLDMGAPVKILDVAKRMIAMSGKEGVQIQFTGLRPGEKMTEVLFGRDEVPHPTAHPLIRSVDVPVIAPSTVTEEDMTEEGFSQVCT